MRKIIFIISVTFLASLLNAQPDPEWLWAARAGGGGYEAGTAITTDSMGNIYTGGSFSGSASFGPFTLNCAGNMDLFVTKQDPAGNWIWAVRAGGGYNVNCEGISVDDLGNVYLTGDFNISASFGTININSVGQYDIYVAKLDPSGNWLWALCAGSPNMDGGYGIVFDEPGNVYLTGYFSSAVSFGADVLTSTGGLEIFVAKLDTAGNWLWAVQGGGTDTDRSDGIAVDNLGLLHITGWFNGTASFGTHTLTCAGMGDIFIARLDQDGNWLAASRAGGTSTESGRCIGVDGSGNACIIGTFYGTISFGDIELTDVSNYTDVFVAKLDPSGDWLWACRCGSNQGETFTGIAVDVSGNSYIIGDFEGTAAFGPFSLTSSGDKDVYVAKLDPSGIWLWAQRVGGTGYDVAQAIAVNAQGYVHMTGAFQLTADFGPFTLTSVAQSDIFIAKLYSHTTVNDLAALAVAGETSPLAGVPSEYTVAVQNNGNTVQSGYLVKLFLEGEVELGTVIGNSILPDSTQTFSLYWTPAVPGPTYLYGVVELTGDQNIANNQTPNLDVIVEYVPGTLMAIVNDLQYQPIAGACVNCGGQTGSTDTGGVCILQLAPGSYVVSASHPDYIAASQNVEVISGQMVMIEFLLSSVDADDPATPELQTALLRNDPNPFGVNTTIFYSLKEAGSVNISIHNLKGELVTTLLDATKNPGQHIIGWNGTDHQGCPVANGVYFCTLRAGGQRSLRRLVLLK